MKRALSTFMLVLLLASMLTVAFNVHEARTTYTTIIVPDDYPTIQAAIDSANEGDTVFVRNGVYYEHVDVDKSVSLVGESQQGTIVDGNFTGGAFCLTADRVTVTGFTMRNGGPGWPGCGICACSDGNNISHNIITNNVYGIWLTGSNGNTISDNDATSNSYAGISLGGSVNNTISNNNVTSNRRGVSVDSGVNYDVWSMNVDGSSQTRLTYDKSSEDNPRWSPNGSRIAYTHTPPCDYNSDIWIMNPDGTNKTQITTNSRALLGGWSPDCSQIVFYSYRTGNSEIWVMNADGTNQRQLTKDQGANYRPAWSPDGTKIAFLSYRANTTGIWIMSPDGTEQVQLTEGIPVASCPSWSPDGSKIAFDSYDYGSRRSTIWIMNRDGTNLTHLASSQFQEAFPQWSPDGAKIAYGGGDDWWMWDIWVMNADGTNKTRLTDNTRTRICSWSPDSSKLAFALSLHVQSADNSIIDNTVANNQEVGMTISWDGTRNTVERNLIHSNGHGLNLVQANENVIINNTIMNNTRGSYQGFIDCGTGIYLDRSESNLLRDNKLTDNAVNFLIGPDYPVEQGIRDYYVNDVDESNLVNGRPICYWVNQSDRQVPANAGCVLLVNSTNILVENLPNLEHNGFGVELYRTTNSTIRNVTASNNLFYGIDIVLSNGNDLFSNTAASNTLNGIRIQLSSGNSLANNTVTNTISQAGLSLMSSGTNTLRSNVMAQNRINFLIASGPPTYYPYYDNDVDTTNTVEGKPIYYWINQHNRTVPSDGGTVLLVNCSDITVKDLDIMNGGVGVGLLNTVSSEVENVTLRDCWVGVALSDSSGNSVSDCTIAGGTPVFFSPIAMMIVNGSENTIERNLFANMTGSVLGQGPSSLGTGLIVIGSFNKIFHNNFVNNTVHASTMEGSYGNVWDDGYPSGGNYWSDYTGVDVYRGSNQNETGSDGIGDTPYDIEFDNEDSYPLMKPFPWDQHDIGVTSLSASKTVCGQGYKTRVNTMVFNYGENTETLNVTAYANETIPIEIVQLELAGKTPVTVNFTWNTTGFAYGNYSISAYASSVDGETDTTDNTMVDGWVYVSIPGDINGDKYVNAKDAVLLGSAFYPAGTYDPNADINDDGYCNAKDAVILGTYFGQHWS